MSEQKDIVDLLRNNFASPHHGGCQNCYGTVMDEAADEIESLRAAKDEYFMRMVRAESALGKATAALKDARDNFEFIRLHLIGELKEPLRSVFWKAVESRDAIASTLQEMNE